MTGIADRIQAPKTWKLWPYLPLHRKTIEGETQHACLIDSLHGYLLYEGATIHDPPSFTTVERRKVTAQDVADAGWQIDE